MRRGEYAWQDVPTEFFDLSIDIFHDEILLFF